MAAIALRELLKRCRLLVNAVHLARDGFRTNYEIVNELAAFVSPDSSGSLQARGGLALQSVQQTFPLICSLIEAISQSLIAPRPIETLFPAQADSSGAGELAALSTNMAATSRLCTTIISCTHHFWVRDATIHYAYSKSGSGRTTQT
jgi:hypothetical protein